MWSTYRVLPTLNLRHVPRTSRTKMFRRCVTRSTVSTHPVQTPTAELSWQGGTERIVSRSVSAPPQALDPHRSGTVDI